MSTSVENQLKTILPTNNDTRTITYNEHFIISNNPLRRVAWEVSKVEDTTTWGLTKLTFKQELEYDPVDNLSWINTTSENYSDAETGIDYDYYCARSNDTLNHDPVSPDDVATSIITYTGLKPSLKTGGGFKTFTANLYKHGVFVPNRPYWLIKYFIKDTLVCKLNFIYVDDRLVCDNSNGDFVIAEDNSVTYLKDGQQLFGIKFKHDIEKPMELKLKCLPILNMIGGKIILSVDDDITESITSPASLEVEVEGL